MPTGTVPRHGCKDCRFFFPTGNDGTYGVCRRRAPYPVVTEAVASILAVWPWVNVDDWCGEFEAP